MRPIVVFGAALCICSVGCGGRSNPVNAANLSFTSAMTSQSTVLSTYNGGTSVSGWNRLVGPSTINWKTVNPAGTVEMLATVAYTRGNGPFFGVVNVTTTDGSQLSFQMTGTATLPSGTTITTFAANLTVLGGNGQFAGATGSGTMTGTRNSALGGDVNLAFQLNIAQ